MYVCAQTHSLATAHSSASDGGPAKAGICRHRVEHWNEINLASCFRLPIRGQLLGGTLICPIAGSATASPGTGVTTVRAGRSATSSSARTSLPPGTDRGYARNALHAMTAVNASTPLPWERVPYSIVFDQRLRSMCFSRWPGGLTVAV